MAADFFTMNIHRFLTLPGALLFAANLSAQISSDARITSWLLAPSGDYARLYPSDAAKNAGTSVTTWSRGQGVQSLPTYAGVAQVSYSPDWVYLRSSGLGYHVMGPWYLNTAHTQLFPNFPANTDVLYRIPRNPVVATTKTLTNGGAIGYSVDGVAIFDNRDTFSYYHADGADGEPQNGVRGDGVWNRDAYVNEKATFDPGYAHQAGSQYHYHANMPVLRYLLGDHVNYDAATKTYGESTAPVTKHSPIIGWMADGYPIYGPYGYASPLDPTSGVRRMISGYVPRDGTNGTTDLAATGRTTLPAWAAAAQNRSATLPSNLQGPNVSTTYPLGHYIEDYDYLGDLGKTQGVDFDLDRYNGRYCVTPEFPAGTYAYFLTIASDGTPEFPYTIGRWFYGSPTGGEVSSIGETVTEYVRGAPTAAITVTATAAGDQVDLSWNSAEGATYQVESSPDKSAWTMLDSAVTSEGTTTGYTAAKANYYRVTLTAIAAYDTGGNVGTAVGTAGTVMFNAPTAAPTITAEPASTTAAGGATVDLSVQASGAGPLSYQWSRNGVAISGATGATLVLTKVQPADAGLYRVAVSNAGGTTTSALAIVGLGSTAKVTGAGSEVASNIVNPNGNVYDQVLLSGAAATVTADAGQVTRISYVDLNDDIVQVEFAGAGALTLTLDEASGPAVATNYDQPGVTYMKGHAGIVITGADETTNVSVFSVGRANAVNQALFRDDVTYDGWADIAFVAIESTDGKFGGVRTADASYYASKGLTGIYAPGVQITGPVYLGELAGFDAAEAELVFGATSAVEVTGGSLAQPNGGAVEVSGISELKFVDGTSSAGVLAPAQNNAAVLEDDGANLTATIVVNPGL